MTRSTNTVPGGAPDAASFRDAAVREAEFFDSYISNEGEFDPFQPRGWETIRRSFEKLVGPTKPLRILDVGCGTGQSRQLYEKHAEFYAGVDLSRVALGVAHKKF